MRSAPQRSRHLAPGDKLGKYDLIRQIAVGGMAELYLARTVGIEGFEKLVVVKRILPQNVTNANFVDMFLNEARLAATLHHPNIAQVYDIGVEDGDYFFAMEYVHGEDLDRISSTSHEQGVPLSFDAALTLIAGLCAGLHYAHEKLGPDGKPLEVVHRDVSPSNVLISYDGAVKVVDFGIARATTRSTKTQGGLKGKIAYMSPEQCRAKATLDRRSDIFSIGTILYELTTGQLPFSGESEYAVLNQIVNDDVPPPSKIVPEYPPALEKIVLRALARDPDQRYPTAVQLQQHIEDFAHENRLRVSPLVLARLMSSLFPARLEEWDQAKTQGAFFVEQHVLRTLIESGKTSDNAQAFPSDSDVHDTTVAPPPIMSEPARMSPAPSGRVPSFSGRAPFGTPPAASQSPPKPPSQMPRATPARAAAPPAPIPTPPPHIHRAATPPAPLPATSRAAAQTPPAPLPPPPEPPRRATPYPPPIESQPPPRPTPTPVPQARPSPTPGQPIPTQVPGAMRTAVPGTLRSSGQLPNAVPILSIGSQVPGTLVSTQSLPDAIVQYPAPAHLDVTERVRIPTRLRSDTSYVNATKRTPVIAIAAGGAFVIAVISFIAFRGHGSTKRPVFEMHTESTAPQAMPASGASEDKPAKVVVDPPAAPAPPSVEAEKPAPVAEKPAPPVDKPVAAATEPVREPEPIKAIEPVEDLPKPPPVRPKVTKTVKPRPKTVDTPKGKVEAKPKSETKIEPKIETKPKPEPKEKPWNADSPFLPVRPEKR